MVQTVADNFSNVIVLLNIGAMIDTSWFAYNDRIQSEWAGILVRAFPVATCLACSWNLDLIEEIGSAGALEV